MKRIPRTVLVYIVSVVVMALLTALKFTKLPPEIPLLFSLPATATQVVDTWMIAVIPIVSLVFILINNFIATRFFKTDDFVRRIIYIANISIIVFFTYIFVRIILLVT